MKPWLLLDVQLQFADKIRTKFPRDYRPDVVSEGTDVYYGMHVLSAPQEIHSGDRVTARVFLRAYPKDPCLSFQPGKKIFVKEGPITVAEGVITNRMGYQSTAVTVIELQQELLGGPQ